MAIGSIGDKVDLSELQKTKDKLNPPEYDLDFAPPSGGGGDEFGFDDLDLDGGNDASGFGSMGGLDFGFAPSSGDGLSGLGGGLDGGFSGGLSGGLGTFGFGTEQTPKAPPKKDFSDEAFEYLRGVSKSFGSASVSFVKSFRNRNLDDWGLLGNNVILCGLALTGIGAFGSFLGAISGVSFFKFAGLSGKLIICGGTNLGFGLMILGGSALIKLRSQKYTDFNSSESSLSTIKDTSEYTNNSSFGVGEDSFSFNDSEGIDDLDSDLSSALDELFGGLEDDDDEIGNLFNDSSNSGFSGGEQESYVRKPEKIDYNELVSNVTANTPYLSRKVLFETFKPFFITNTEGFDSVKTLDHDSDDFLGILSLLNSAMASAAKVDDINCELVSVKETKFSYELKFKRHPKLTNTKVMQEELENYFKSSKNDAEVTATVDILGNFNIATILKGNKETVTLGDCFQLDYVQEFFLNEKNKMPFVMGVDVDGKVLIEDCSKFPAMMIVGMQRSGKSWYINGIIMCLAVFNRPTDIQFCIIDPKDSLLFNTVSLLPHVCGLGGVKDVIPFLDDLINKEGKRRKKLLKDNRCETMWDLRNKGIEVPFIYLVIDEVVTIVKTLDTEGSTKEFLDLLLIAITQLPSLGIGVLIVPHRAQSIIDKGSRQMITYTAAVKAKNELVNEALGITDWKKSLVNPGDIALNTTTFSSGPKFVRGTGITLSDSDNVELIATIARTFYKMGVEIPDMSTVGRGYNRDEQRIQEELKVHAHGKTQFDIDDI